MIRKMQIADYSDVYNLWLANKGMGETNLFIHCGYWKCRRISESVTFFKSIQEYLWNFSKKLAH